LRKLLQSKSPIASWATILLIEVLDKGRSFDEAIKECKNFIRYFPTNDKLPQVKLKLAKIYVKLGKKKEAREIYKEILLLYPNSTVAPISRGELENL
jgi:TolA-binding protein